jgi:hypothetical protein
MIAVRWWSSELAAGWRYDVVCGVRSEADNV